MPATVTLRAMTGANAATVSSVITAIDLLYNKDSATTSLANRKDYPLQQGRYSTEKWLKLSIDIAPATKITDIRIWIEAAIPQGTKIFYGFTATGATPVKTPSAIAINDLDTLTASNKAVWDSGNYTAVGRIANYLVLQAFQDYYPPFLTGVEKVGKSITQVTIKYSYEET